MTLEALPVKTAIQYQADFQATLQGISEGTLNDFSSGSVLTFLSELFGEGFGSLDATVNDRITNIVFGSVAQLFGVQNVAGTYAQIKLIFFPTNIDRVASFLIDTGFSVLVNGVLFRTDSQVSVPPGSLFAEVTATAAEVGLRGNISVSSEVAWQVVPGLANVAIAQTNFLIKPGSDALDYASATNALTGLLVNQALITVADYEALLSQRFAGLIFSVIQNLDKDKVTKKAGIIHIFGCNPDYSVLSAPQKLAVSDALKDGWALIYVDDFNLLTLRVSVIADLTVGSDPTTVSTAINAALKIELSPVNQKGKRFISLYDLLGSLYSVSGVDSIPYLSLDTGDGVFKAENIPLPNLYTLVRLGAVNVQFEGLLGVYANANI
jgi:Baseplate J-like protein